MRIDPRYRWLVAFCGGVVVGAMVTAFTVVASNAILEPSGDGTITGVPTNCAGTNASCLADGTLDPSLPNTSDFVTFADGDSDYYEMDTITGVDTATSATAHIYHLEGNANMAVYVSLWDATETTQYGTEQVLTNRTGAQWDSVTFTGLTLSQTQLDGVKTRLLCQRPGGGRKSDCTAYAMYLDVSYSQTVDVSVSSTGSQQNLAVPTTTAHVGGAFVITEQSSGRDITEITVTETGSVDAQNDLDNISLFYELAADCSIESYDGTEEQFGVTDTDGFSGSNGTSTFSDTVAISTSNELCVYPVLDVLSSAAAEETVQLEISDPTTDVVGTGAPFISPSTPVALSGDTVLQAEDLRQMRYHWRLDDGTEQDASSATNGAEDTAISEVSANDVRRLRVAISNEGNDTETAAQYRLEWADRITTCDAATGWTDVGATADHWDMATSSNLVEGNDTTDIALSTGGVTNENTTFLTPNGGQRDQSSQTGALTLADTEFVELEYAIVAGSSVSPGSSYCFRVTDAGTPINYDVYPEASIAAGLEVAAFGSQVQSIDIPTTDAHNGGGFSVSDPGDPGHISSHEMTAMTITATGTVDLLNDIRNIELWYEYDTTSPFDCTDEAFDGDEVQYGSTVGNFATDYTATFTGSLLASSTQTICLYPVYDVDTGATDGEQIELRIANASTDVETNGESVAPSSLVDIDGVTDLVAPVVAQEHYHWRDNTGTEADASSLTDGVEDTPYTELPKETVARLRLGVSNTGGTTTAPEQYRLEWAQRVTTCNEASGWTDIDAGGDGWSIVDSQLIDNADTTDIPLGNGGVTNVGTFLTPNSGQQEVDGQTGDISIGAGEYLELEYSLQAGPEVNEGSSYCFRVSQAGSELDVYNAYARATIKLGTDFLIQRGTTTIPAGATTATINAGVDYQVPAAATSSFIRILNTNRTGRGPEAGASGGFNSDEITAHISDPSNLTNSVTFQRSGTTNDTYIAWEIVEYIGNPGGENEIYVRDAGTVTYGTAATTVTTPTVVGVVDDAAVVPFIIGQSNPDTGRFDYNTGLSTATWDAGGDTATFTRGEAGGDASVVSYAVVEFTGANWNVQRSEHSYTSAGVTETESITAVNSTDRAFIHSQHRAGTDQDTHADFGAEVWLSSIGNVSYRLSSAAQDPSLHTTVAWVVENTQTTGDVMEVNRVNGSVPAGGGGLTSVTVPIGSTVEDLTATGLFLSNTANGADRTFPEPIISAQLLDDTQFQLQVTDDTDTISYDVQVVEWPTASRKLYQDSYRLYADNDTLTPDDPWPVGTSTDLGENAAMTVNDGPIGLGESIRLRMSLRVSAAAMPAGVDAFRLQYAENPGSCSAVGPSAWIDVGDAGSTTALWRGHAGLPADGDTLPSLLLSGSTVAATYEENEPSSLTPNLALVGDEVEFDWNIEHNGATDKTDYCFRMVEGDGGTLEGYDTYPQIRTAGYEPIVANWRWYDDATSTTPTDPLAPENVAPNNIANQTELKLRLVLAETAGATGENTKFALQYSERSDFATGSVKYVRATTTCTDDSIWCYADGAGVDNELIDTALISGADACSAGTGAGCGTRNEATTTISTFDHAALSNAEFEFTVQQAGARVNAVYYFRLYDLVNDTVVTASSSYPSLMVEGSGLTFSVGGVPSGVAVDGVAATDATTTPTAVEFGSIPIDTEYTAAQRLSIDTNATDGYQVFTYSRNGLVNTYGTEIPAVSASNTAPAGWASVCSSSATGCFGYHTSDDVLAGGSTRFSAADSYATFSTTPAEIMYNSAPATETHDFVYKVQIGELQEAGDYQTDVVFIAAPAF